MSPAACPGWRAPVEQDDRPAHRVPEHDRPFYPGRVAEAADVVGAGLETPPGCLAPGRPAVPPQIEVDDLGKPGEPGEVRLEVRVIVDPRAAMNQNHCRPLPHLVPVRHQHRAIHVEPQPRPIHADVHRADPPTRARLPPSLPGRSASPPPGRAPASRGSERPFTRRHEEAPTASRKAPAAAQRRRTPRTSPPGYPGRRGRPGRSAHRAGVPRPGRPRCRSAGRPR